MNLCFLSFACFEQNHLSCVEDECSWHNVLNPSPGVAPRHPHQELQGVRGHCHAGRRDQSQQGEQKCPCPVGVEAALGQTQRLEVVRQGDGDDREVGGEGEHREEGEKVVDPELEPGV